MDQTIKRKKYWLHPSSQLKYIHLTVLPALLLTIFCLYFLIKSGEIFLGREKEQLSVEISYLNDTISRLAMEHYPQDAILKVEVLKKRLTVLERNLEVEYFQTMKDWSRTKMIVLIFLAVVLILTGIVALIFSHRIAGPIYRLRKLTDMLAEGKDIPSVKFRKHDEFKELADSFEKLRKSLKAKGFLS